MLRDEEMTTKEALNIIADMCNALQLHPNSRQGKAIMMAINSLKNGTPPVENKGKWIEDEDIDVTNDGKFAVKCSKCDEYNGYRKTNFCPNCGVKMTNSSNIVSELEKKNRKIIIDMLKDK